MLPGKLILISGYKGRCVDQSHIITQGFGWGCNCLIYDKDAGFLFVIQTYYVNVYSSEHMSITVLNKYYGQFTFFFSLFNYSERKADSVSVFCICVLYSVSSWVFAGNSSLQALLIQSSLSVPGANSACGCGERNIMSIPGMGFGMQKSQIALCKFGHAIKTGYIQQQVLGYCCFFFYRIVVNLFLS